MYSAMSSPAAWNTGNACSTSANRFRRGALRLAAEAEQAPVDSPAELVDTIAGRRRTLGEGIGAPDRVSALPVQNRASPSSISRPEVEARQEVRARRARSNRLTAAP